MVLQQALYDVPLMSNLYLLFIYIAFNPSVPWHEYSDLCAIKDTTPFSLLYMYMDLKSLINFKANCWLICMSLWDK